MTNLTANQQRIIAMTKLSLYDKDHGTADRHILRFYRQDYIYRRNMWTRVYIIIALLVWYLLYWFNQIAVKGVDILGLDYKAELIKIGWQALGILVLFSLIGGIQASREYARAKKRHDEYLKGLTNADKLLEKEAEEARRAQEEDEDEEEGLYDGPAFPYTRYDR